MGDRKVMSLINKMLQDLDARGTPGAESFPSQIRPVARERASLGDRFDSRSAAMAFAGVAVCAFGAALWFGWSHYRHAQAPARPAAVAAAPAKAAAPSPAPAPAAMQASQGMTGTITMGPANAAASAPPAAPLPVPAPVAAAAAPKSVAGFEPDSDEARAARQAIMAELQARMSASSKPAAIAHASTRAEKRKALAEAREAKSARHAKAGADKLAASAAVKGKRGAQGVQGMQGMENPAPQRAEGEYRHALTALQDGRMTEALAALEQALKIDPSHDAARQTLVGLLIEARRSDDAIRHLQAGLALDVRQPSLAMLLARLQIERGGSGIDTLMRTLPYAGSNADYHAFLAGALQREQRHREAAEQYQAALRAAPANGVWWMGLGMSLQAEKRNAEALDAFQRARISGMLSVELQAFVERRLQMLAR
jgi:MSHA biogenesis protein MshN